MPYFYIRYICKLLSLPAQVSAVHLLFICICYPPAPAADELCALKQKTLTALHTIQLILVYRSLRTNGRTPPTNSPFFPPRTNYLPKNFPLHQRSGVTFNNIFSNSELTNKLPGHPSRANFIPGRIPLHQRPGVTCNNIFSNSELTSKLPLFTGRPTRTNPFPGRISPSTNVQVYYVVTYCRTPRLLPSFQVYLKLFFISICQKMPRILTVNHNFKSMLSRLHSKVHIETVSY